MKEGMEARKEKGKEGEKLSERACDADGWIDGQRREQESERREGREGSGQIRRGGGEARKQQNIRGKGTKESPGEQCLKFVLLIAG
jgi:hypothetical protein